MGHTAVQTYVEEGFLAVEATLRQTVWASVVIEWLTSLCDATTSACDSESNENRGSPTGPAHSQDRRRGPARTIHRDSPVTIQVDRFGFLIRVDVPVAPVKSER